MRFVVLIAFLALQAQLPPEAYPGQREHKEPPKGFFCSPVAKDAAHRCFCKRMAQSVKGDECCENVKPENISEDAKCTVWCHKDHCQCPVQCSVKGHAGH